MTKYTCLFLLITGLSSASPTGSEDLSEVWNHFAATANTWAKDILNEPKGTVSVQQYRDWAEVKREFHKLEPQFDHYYHQ